MFLRLASELKMNQTISTTQQSFYSPKESSLSIVGPLGLSGSLFLGLLVFDFYHPTNRDLYSPKERFLKEPLRGVPFVWLLSFLYLIVFWKFYPPTKQTFSTSYSPKERFLKEPLRGVPFVWVLSFLYLIEFKILHPYEPWPLFGGTGWVGLGWGGAYFFDLWNFLGVKKWVFKIFFFSNVFNYQGERF